MGARLKFAMNMSDGELIAMAGEPFKTRMTLEVPINGLYKIAFRERGARKVYVEGIRVRVSPAPYLLS